MPPELLPLRSYVVAGDCVQLRLKGDAGYVRYTFKGDVNVPRRSIIAIGDPRAKALLGRNIGDQVAFEIAGRDRLVVIEKIVVAAVTARTSTHAGMVGCATRTYRCG